MTCSYRRSEVKVSCPFGMPPPLPPPPMLVGGKRHHPRHNRQALKGTGLSDFFFNIYLGLLLQYVVKENKEKQKRKRKQTQKRKKEIVQLKFEIKYVP